MTFSAFLKKYGIRLTTQQEKAVLKTDGYTLLLAVPGSGKTTVIVSRLGYMIHQLNIPYDSILTLTYSVASCNDMKSRYISLFGNTKLPQFRTIHGLCALIIMEYEKQFGRNAFRLIEGDTKESDILTEIYTQTYGKFPDIGSINDLKRQIGYVRNMMLTEKEAEEYSDDGLLGKILTEYKNAKTKLCLMDYDDQLEFAYKILIKYPEIREAFRKRYKYINVDEAQDTSKLQHEIIGLLTDKNLFMVGDEDQSIYGFRAAFPTALMEFSKKYPGSEILLMEENFRSTKNIIRHASKLICHNTERREKNMFTSNSEGEDIKIMDFSNYFEQFGFLKNICNTALNSDEKNAILFRNNESVIPLIDLLDRDGIEYTVRENDSLYFSSPSVLDMLKMLEYCENPENQDLFIQTAPKSGCGLTKITALEILEKSKKNNTSLYSEFKNHVLCKTDKGESAKTLFREIENYGKRKLSETIILLCKDTCFGRFLEHRFKDKLKTAVLAYIAKNCKNLDELKERLSYLCNLLSEGKSTKSPCIMLSTIHSSKGLEYDNVYIIDVKDGNLPGNPQSKSDLSNTKAFLEEERRLFYVAVTRAKKRVVLIKYYSEFDGTRAEGSSFIRELTDKRTGITQIAKSKVTQILKSKKEKTDEASSFVQGTYIIHNSFGKGQITKINGDKCTVRFENVTKTISLSICLDAGIIKKSNNK